MGLSLCSGIFAPMQTYNAIHETYICVCIYMGLSLCLGIFARMQTYKAIHEA